MWLYFLAAKMGRRTDRMRSMITTINEAKSLSLTRQHLSNNGRISQTIENVQNTSTLMYKQEPSMAMENVVSSHSSEYLLLSVDFFLYTYIIIFFMRRNMYNKLLLHKENVLKLT